MAKLDRPGRNGGRLNSGLPPEQAAEGGKATRKLPELKEITASALSEDKGGITAAEKILQAHIKQAQAGDVASANFVFGYAYGKPLQRQEVSGADGQPLSIVVQVTPPDVTPNTDPE